MRLAQHRYSPSRYRQGQRPQPRGIVMILVVVVLVLLAIMGMAYMQVVRVDRLANEQFSDNVGVVLSAMIAEIQRELRDDVTFNSTTNVNDPNNNHMLSEVKEDEPFDMPFKAYSGGHAEDEGPLSDNYMASHRPTAGTWAHISWLGIDRDGIVKYEPPLQNVGVGQPQDAPSGPAQFMGQPFTVVPVMGSPTHADADGDGYLDSRWMLPPLDNIGGVNYVGAVRIISHGGLVNAGVYTDTRTATDAPRYWYPIDLDCLTAAPALGVGGAAGEMSTLLSYRFTSSPVLFAAAFPTTYQVRDNYWFHGPSSGFDPALNNVVNASNELELRHKFGLNRDVTEEIEDAAEGGLVTLLRDNAGEETDYPSSNIDNDRRHRLTVMNGVNQLAIRTYGASAQNKIQLNNLIGPGAGFARTTFAQQALLGRDMPFEWDGNSFVAGASNGAPYQSEVSAPLVAAAQYLACLNDYFDGDTETYPNGQVGDFEPQLDSRITRIDMDNSANVVAINTGTVVRYGMEGLPFLTEVYIQAAYWVTAATENDDTDDNDNVYTITWTRSDQAPGGEKIGYAIEMVNPFSSPVHNLSHVRLVVNGTSWGTLQELTGQSRLDAVGQTKYGIILHRDSDGSANSNNGSIQQSIDTFNGDPDSFVSRAHVAAISNVLSIPGAGDDVVVELQVLVDDGTTDPLSEPDGSGDEWITYSRIQRKVGDGTTAADSDDRLWLPTTVTKTNVDLGAGADQNGKSAMLLGNGGKDYERFIQRTALCDWGEGSGGSMDPSLNPIAVKCKDGDNEMSAWGTDPGDDMDPTAWSTEWPIPNLVTANPMPPNTAVGQIGKADKDNTPSGLTSQVAPNWVEPFLSDAAAKRTNYAYAFDDVGIRYVTDIYRPMWVGPTATEIYAEVFRKAALNPKVNDPDGNPDELRSRMMTFQDLNAAATQFRAIPRGQLILDRVIAVRAGGSTPLYGMVNINEISEATLREILPLNPAMPSGGDIITEIREFREGSGAGAANKTRGATERAFVSIGELLQLPSIRNMARDGTFTAVHGVQIAFDGGGNPIPAAGPSTYPVSAGLTGQVGVPDGRTEEVRIAGMLANVVTTRSDFFTAYIVIQGYRDDWVNPSETGQFIAVFDRTNVTNGSALPKVVAVHRVK